MRYKDAVAEARRLVKRSEEDQWRLTELSWEQYQAGKSQRQWARDIGVHQTQVGVWCRMWERWREERAIQRPPFPKAYNIISGRAAETEEHGSQYQAEARRALRNLPAEKKAEVVEELLDDADQKVRHAAIKALDKHYDRERELRQRETPTAPPSAYDAAIELLVRQRAITAAIKTATDLVMSGAEFGDTTDNVAIADWQINALNILRTAISGRSGMDAELAAILEEG